MNRNLVLATKTGGLKRTKVPVMARKHDWSPPGRAVLIAGLTIAAGSLFLTTYTLALGDPVPHRIDAALVGDRTQHARKVDAVERVADGSLTFHRYRSAAAAHHAIDVQRVYAALDVTSKKPTLYVASAAGASVARVLERVAASAPGVRVVDTHPLSASDPNGLDIFYLMLVATIIGFLTVFQVRANAGGLGLQGWTAWVVGFALAAALALTLVVGPGLDRFNVPVAETWGILALHIVAVASFASVMTVLVGDPSGLALLRRAGQQLVWRRRLAAAAAGAIRVHFPVAPIGRHRYLASRRDLFPRLPARASDPCLGGLGGDALRRDAHRIAPPPDEPRRSKRAERARLGVIRNCKRRLTPMTGSGARRKL
jgi:hypothetical protein